jgi:hypothetical protein
LADISIHIFGILETLHVVDTDAHIFILQSEPENCVYHISQLSCQKLLAVGVGQLHGKNAVITWLTPTANNLVFFIIDI